MVQNDSAKLQYNPLVKRVGTSSPPGQEQRQSNSFHKLSRDANTDCIDGAFLRQDLREETRSSRSGKDQAAEIGSTLVAQRPRGIDQGANAITLEGRANKRGAPGNGSATGLLGLDKLFLGVGLLGALVGLAKDGAKNSELDAVVEKGA